MEKMTSLLRLRMSAKDAHYGGNLVDGAHKVIVSRPDISASAADVLDEPVIVCRAHGTCVTPKDCQRKEIKK